KLGRVDIAFLPINLPYTMPPAEAANAARMIHPRILYPYHQGQSNPNDLKEALASQKGTQTGVVKWFNDAKGYGSSTLRTDRMCSFIPAGSPAPAAMGP